MTTREQDKIGLWVAVGFVVYAIIIVLSALFSAPRIGGHHGAPRVTPAPVAARWAIGSRISESQSTTQHAERGATAPRSDSGPTGFDTERESVAIVQAVSARFEQLANPNCERQRGFRSSCGLTDVDVQGALVAHRCKPTRDRSRHSASAAQIQRMVEGFRAPGSMGCQRAPNAGYARERTTKATFVDRGSIPRGSTLTSFSKPEASAQQQESAGRPASEDDCASGSEAGQSAAEQPAMILAT